MSKNEVLRGAGGFFFHFFYSFLIPHMHEFSVQRLVAFLRPLWVISEGGDFTVGRDWAFEAQGYINLVNKIDLDDYQEAK